ncbi:MAG: SUMF1/EgtB/PvdO family nonheme iron enzyme [Planctomycetota bacterium]
MGSFATATSVYGLRDAVGNTWEWTASTYDVRRWSRIFRGGGWVHPVRELACCTRSALNPRARFNALGLRCVRDLPGV